MRFRRGRRGFGRRRFGRRRFGRRGFRGRRRGMGLRGIRIGYRM